MRLSHRIEVAPILRSETLRASGLPRCCSSPCVLSTTRYPPDRCGWPGEADDDAGGPDLGSLCAGRDQPVTAAGAGAVSAAPWGNARVTAAVRLDTCSLV